MSTKIRPDISKKHKYYISKHRYYELKHFCLQYNEWKEKSLYFGGLIKSRNFPGEKSGKQFQNPVLYAVEERAYYESLISIIERAAVMTDPVIGIYILKAVTEDLSFVQLKMQMEIPCGKDMYYDRYRKFFYILSNSRSLQPL